LEVFFHRRGKLHSTILAPLVALVLWSFVMWAWLYATRIPAVTKGKIIYDSHRPAEEFHAQLPAQVRWKADNYNNLMEQPTSSTLWRLHWPCSVQAKV
jgi:hypothetical protein